MDGIVDDLPKAAEIESDSQPGLVMASAILALSLGTMLSVIGGQVDRNTFTLIGMTLCGIAVATQALFIFILKVVEIPPHRMTKKETVTAFFGMASGFFGFGFVLWNWSPIVALFFGFAFLICSVLAPAVDDERRISRRLATAP